jgi:F0F1-type ATP synthase membrane subunit b/b'
MKGFFSVLVFVLVVASMMTSRGLAATDKAAANTDWQTDRAEFKKDMEDELAKIRKQIGELETQVGEASGKAKTELNKQLDSLEKRRMILSRRLDAASKTSGRAWDKMKIGLEKAMVELKMAYGAAKKEFDEKTDEPSNDNSKAKE